MTTSIRTYTSLAVAVVALFALTLLVLSQGPLSAQAQKKPAAKPPAQDRGMGQDASPQQPQDTTRALGLVQTLPGKQKRYALIIGVDQYNDPQVTGLAAASNDARLLADALVRYAGFPADQVVLLTSNRSADWQPTRGNILRKLSNLAAVVPKDGLLLFSFAGHGIERNQQAFLLPADAQVSDDVNLLEQTAVNVVQIKEWVRKTGVGQVLLLLDACRNDPAAGRAAADNPLSKNYMRGFNFDVRNREVQAFATLYATEIGRRAYERRDPRHGYFTLALVEGLKGGAVNERGEVTLATLVKYLQDNVPRRVLIDLGQGKVQKPFAVVEGYRADELVLSVKDPQAAAAADANAKAIAAEAPAQTAADTTAVQAIGRTEELPLEGGLAGTAWTGTSPEIIDGEYTVEFLKDGQLNYIFNRIVNGQKERTTVKGKWRQVESFVQITVGGFSVWQGKLDAGIIKGTTSNVEGVKGEFLLLKKSP